MKILKNWKKYFGLRSCMFLLLLALLPACGGPDICACNTEALKENPDKAIIEQCRKMLSEMETEEIIKAQAECDGPPLPDEPPKSLDNMM